MQPLADLIIPIIPSLDQINAYFQTFLQAMEVVRLFILQLRQSLFDFPLFPLELSGEFFVVGATDFFEQDVAFAQSIQPTFDLLQLILNALGREGMFLVLIFEKKAKFAGDERDVLRVGAEIIEEFPESLRDLFRIDAGRASPRPAFVIRKLRLAVLALALLHHIAGQFLSTVFAIQEAFQGQQFIFSLDLPAHRMGFLHDLIDRQKDLMRNKRFVDALDDFSLEGTVCDQPAIERVPEDAIHGIFACLQALTPHDLLDFLRTEFRVLVFQEKGLAHERSVFRVNLDLLVHPLVADRGYPTPLSLPEPGKGAVHASLAPDVVFHLGEDQLHVLHARAVWGARIDGHGR